MYTLGHIIFIVISLLIVALIVFVCKKNKWQIDNIIKVAFVIAVICEIIKVFSLIDIYPIVDSTIENGAIVYRETGQYFPYLEVVHMPFELCSLQMFFMFIYLTIKDATWKRRIYALIYGTALIGGILAIFASYVAIELETAGDFLLSIRVWEFYIYHAMIMAVAILMAMDNKYKLQFKDCKSTCVLIFLLDIVSIHLNSIFSIPVYVNGKLIGLNNSVNFFSSYSNPLGTPITNKYQYLFYLLTRFLIVLFLIIIIYLPFLKKRKN